MQGDDSTKAGGPTGGRHSGQRLGALQRLRRPGEFDEAFSQQRKFVGRFMVMWLRRGEGASLRLGVVSSRKVGAAVRRVRARRRLREVYRTQRVGLAGDVDVVLVARAGVVDAAWPAVVEDFIQLARRAGLVAGSTG